MDMEKPKEKASIEMDEEARANLVTLFSILLQVDKRLHPENYRRGAEPDD